MEIKGVETLYFKNDGWAMDYFRKIHNPERMARSWYITYLNAGKVKNHPPLFSNYLDSNGQYHRDMRSIDRVAPRQAI